MKQIYATFDSLNYDSFKSLSNYETDSEIPKINSIPIAVVQLTAARIAVNMASFVCLFGMSTGTIE